MFILLAGALIAAAIYGGIVYYAKSKEKYHLRPRTAWAQVAVIGRTEDAETVQLSASLMDDESATMWNKKLQWLYETREDRLKFQNERIQKLVSEAEENKKKAEEALKEGGIKLVPPSKG